MPFYTIQHKPHTCKCENKTAVEWNGSELLFFLPPSAKAVICTVWTCPGTSQDDPKASET